MNLGFTFCPLVAATNCDRQYGDPMLVLVPLSSMLQCVRCDAS
jgi:hypothetical protein